MTIFDLPWGEILKAALIALAFIIAAGNAAASPSDPCPLHSDSSSSELQQLVREDQADRATPAKYFANLANNMPRDAARKEAVRRLLSECKLHSGEDFEGAALIFQHSAEPDNLLFAHVLAMAALQKGRESAGRLAAATLDRYLHAIGRSQVFGTQYSIKSGQPLSQEPFDRALISDDLRRQLGVPALADQATIHEKELQEANAAVQFSTTATMTANTNIRCEKNVGERVFLRVQWTVYSCSDDHSLFLSGGGGSVVATTVGNNVVVTVASSGDKQETDAAVAALKALSMEQLKRIAIPR